LLNRQSELLAGAPQRIMQWDTITGKDEKLAPLPGNREAEIIPQKLKCSFKAAGAASFAPVFVARATSLLALCVSRSYARVPG
jgi:hypothetical protein